MNKFKNGYTKSFTLVEILISITLITVLIIGIVIFINPNKQIEKAQDLQKKIHLSKLQKIFEDYYNDKESYPKAEDVCYDQTIKINNVCFCHICGLSDRKSFFPYLANLFCDPQYPKKEYLYQYDCTTDYPSWYRICAQLSTDDIFGVASPNQTPGECLIDCPPDPQHKYCLKNGICNNCGEFTNCFLPDLCDQPLQLYSDDSCLNTCNTRLSELPISTPTLIPPTSIYISPLPTTTPTPSPQQPISSITPIFSSPTPDFPTPTPLITCPPDPQNKYCLKGEVCNNCGVFANCLNQESCNQPLQLYADFNCNIACY